MNKTEMTNAIYEWLKSDEKVTTVSTGDGKRTAMFVKTPCTKKGYEGVFMVISGDITYMEDWCSTTNFSRAGFWLPDREVFLENDVHSYNFGEENPHFLSESKLIQEVMKLSKKGIFDFYHEKYPTCESLGISTDDLDAAKKTQTKFMDMDWLHGTMPISDWYYFERYANIDWGHHYITTDMCIRYMNGDSDVFYNLFMTPFLAEKDESMKMRIHDVKTYLALAYRYERLKENYKPSARAMATKAIVDGVNTLLAANRDKNIQNVKVTEKLSDNSTKVFKQSVGPLKNYDTVYLFADEVVKVTYGKKVIYEKK